VLASGLATDGLELSLRQDDQDGRLAVTLYHVVLDGRRLGPYDRRTIVGMRVRKTLGSRHLLEASDGTTLTIAELLHGTLPATPPPAPPESLPSGDRRNSYSVIQAMHSAELLDVQGRGYAVPPFKGEVEVRIQTRVLRIAGRFRDTLAWKEDRVKIPLREVVHAGLQGSVVELGVRPPSGAGLQRLRLDLGTPQAARELVEGLPHAVPGPGSEPLAGPGAAAIRRGRRARWAALATGALTALAVAAWLSLRHA